ncbi:Survival of motor neuron-related-splicing factor 30 [Orchesella cincta]|uniref:Survival of motor neuron-related-splicing factor 30 n=1 Tax=Orchesella cincta TaxID=48709 RepID=A0A1D2NLU0_ORCCI|nr:Survival of motor neuron-related-splicing factor 30 [Orchesella cincta]
MAEDLQTNLETYLLQLQQVDAALISDPANDELLKLKSDLTEVIDLTKDLLTQQEPSSMDAEEDDLSSNSWEVGGKCMAPWTQDGQYYEAVIEEIHPDGKVSVGFTQYSQGEITLLSKLKPYIAQSSKSVGAAAGTSGASKRLPPKESLAESHRNHPGDVLAGGCTNHENRDCDKPRTRYSSKESPSSKPPCLFDISPFEINTPKNTQSEPATKAIPSLLSLEITPQSKTHSQPVPLLSLNLSKPPRPQPVSLLKLDLMHHGAGAKNAQGRNGHIPSLLECDIAAMSASIIPPSPPPLLITPPIRRMLVPGSFPNSSGGQQLRLGVCPPPPPLLESLMSPGLPWMGSELPRELIMAVPRTTVNPPRGRRKHCFNCYGYDHTVTGCTFPKNFFKRQWLLDGMN